MEESKLRSFKKFQAKEDLHAGLRFEGILREFAKVAHDLGLTDIGSVPVAVDASQ